MNPLRFSLSILAIAALCSCNQPPTQAVAEPPEPIQVDKEEAKEEQERLELQEQQVALLREFSEATYPSRLMQPHWFGTTARVKELSRRYDSGNFDPDILALDVYAEFRMSATFGWLDMFDRERPDDQLSAEMWQPPRSDDEFEDFRDELLWLLVRLARDHRSYTACEILLIQSLDGFYAEGYSDSSFDVMAKHPGFVSEVITTSPYVQKMTTSGHFREDGYFFFFGDSDTMPERSFLFGVLAEPELLAWAADLERLQKHKAATIAEMEHTDHPVLTKRWQAVLDHLENRIKEEQARIDKEDQPQTN